jgi:hypothetical protein
LATLQQIEYKCDHLNRVRSKSTPQTLMSMFAAASGIGGPRSAASNRMQRRPIHPHRHAMIHSDTAIEQRLDCRGAPRSEPNSDDCEHKPSSEAPAFVNITETESSGNSSNESDSIGAQFG